ncbi:MAG: thiosulfate oxidation carrier complex protein SoxZ [Acidobacteria bacterium]|nr:thiosulfate oxidation carrier complex protein SoxZ [Acidobacteriota bacterium]
MLPVSGLVLLAQDPLLDDMNRQVPVLLGGAQSRSDAQHTPRLKAPRVVEVAGAVAVTVSVPLLGDEKHYIRRLALIDENSLVKLKYLATFSPAVRPVQVTALIKMAKTSRIKAIAECSLHGKWLGVSETILVGMGGCGAGQEPNRKLVGEVLRVRFQDQGAGVETSLLFRHPMLSGYVMTDAGRIVRSYEPFFLRLARVSHNNHTLAEFEIGPGLSENPRISLLLPRLSGEPLKAEAVNSTQQQFTLLARMQ